VARALRSGSVSRLTVAIAVLLLLLQTSEVWAAAPSTSLSQLYPNSSWALGVVVPEGAGLQGGGGVRWEGVTNVTAVVTLPNITLPEGIIYVVLSVMTSDGAVLQAAAGISPNGSAWLVYAWSITGSDSQFVYRWVLNGSEPEMSPNANVSISIFKAKGLWGLKVLDENAGSSVIEQFPPGMASTLRAGDQEVFALESYSKTGATFQDMDNLTLRSLSLNGQRVVSGTYTYGEWDPDHNPVFVVGSSGSSPPAFIYIGKTAGGSYFWEYVGVWGVAGDPLIELVQIIVVVSLIVALSVLGTAIRITRKPARAEPVS
jgi:hypothetical protein